MLLSQPELYLRLRLKELWVSASLFLGHPSSLLHPISPVSGIFYGNLTQGQTTLLYVLMNVYNDYGIRFKPS